MVAEIGATTSIFSYDVKMKEYLVGTERSEIAEMADKISDYLKGDDEVYNQPEK